VPSGINGQDEDVSSAEFAVVVPDPWTTQLADELAELEQALDRGDLETVRRQARTLRRCLAPAEQPTTRSSAAAHLRVVGGVPLTGREIGALHLLTDGSMSQKDMARAMGVTTNTIKTHLKSLYLKLGAHCRGEAIQRARDFGILPPADEDERPIPGASTWERVDGGG
jgi:ATP/maltotriose-dependent transcriptional regulator MalT